MSPLMLTVANGTDRVPIVTAAFSVAADMASCTGTGIARIKSECYGRPDAGACHRSYGLNRAIDVFVAIKRGEHDDPPALVVLADCIAQFVPRNRVVYHWLDVYDLEEERL